MATPTGPDAAEELERLRAELGELRARIERLEDLLAPRAAAMPPEEAMPDDATGIEPGEAWGLKPPGGGPR
jgi:hypothetical protein